MDLFLLYDFQALDLRSEIIIQHTCTSQVHRHFLAFWNVAMDAHVFFFRDVCQPLHQQLGHLINRGRFLELVTQEQSFDLAFEPVTDLLISLLSCRILLFTFLFVNKFLLA